MSSEPGCLFWSIPKQSLFLGAYSPSIERVPRAQRSLNARQIFHPPQGPGEGLIQKENKRRVAQRCAEPQETRRCSLIDVVENETAHGVQDLRPGKRHVKRLLPRLF